MEKTIFWYFNKILLVLANAQHKSCKDYKHTIACWQDYEKNNYLVFSYFKRLWQIENVQHTVGLVTIEFWVLELKIEILRTRGFSRAYSINSFMNIVMLAKKYRFVSHKQICDRVWKKYTFMKEPMIAKKAKNLTRVMFSVLSTNAISRMKIISFRPIWRIIPLRNPKPDACAPPFGRPPRLMIVW